MQTFTNDTNVYQFLLKNLKENNWYKWRGSVKNDDYLHRLVMTVRNIMECDEKSMKKPQEKAPEPNVGNVEPDFYDYGEIPEIYSR